MLRRVIYRWRAGESFPSSLHHSNSSVRVMNGASAFILVAALLSIAPALADGSGDPTTVKNEDGKYFDKQGNPTYKIQPDGTVDYYTYSGFVRYHSECHVCHGPDGMGS